ncbi:hypothetical protein CNY89_24685, partial [Amaricoccus sp. HAR-UPW-R2A-40]
MRRFVLRRRVALQAVIERRGYLGLTPRRYESGETSRNGRISKAGEPDDQEAPLRGGHDASNTQPALLNAKVLGSEAREDVRVQEGENRRGSE